MFKRFWDALDARQAERRAERAHQLEMLTKVTEMLQGIIEAQSTSSNETANALVEIAKSSQAQAEGFTTWLKSFQTVAPPTSTFVSEEDEDRAAEVRYLREHGIELSADDVLPEFRLALELQRDFTDAVRSDTKA